MIVVDFESFLIRPGLLAPRAVCASFAKPNQPAWLLRADRACSALEHILGPDGGGEVLIGHNIPYDLAVAAAYRPALLPLIFKAYEDGRIRDTKLRQQLLDLAAGCLNYPRPDGTKGYHLADLELHHFGLDRSAEKQDPNGWRLRFSELDGLEPHEYPLAAREYALDDAGTLTSGTLGVCLVQSRLAGVADDAPLINEVEQNRKAWALHLASCWGWRTNREATEALEAWARGEWSALQTKMFHAGYFRLEPMTNAEIAEGRAADGITPPTYTATGRLSVVSGRPAKYVKNTELIREHVARALRAQGLEPALTDKGAVKADADALSMTGDALLEELGETGPVGTILKTFVPTLKLGLDVPINTRFNPLLETGRISSSKPNLNNISREGGVRECFVPRPGFVLCSVDYNCAELRSLGQACLWLFGWSKMAEFFRSDPNGDPHLALAASMLGISEDEAKSKKAAGDKTVKNARQSAKCFHPDTEVLTKSGWRRIDFLEPGEAVVAAIPRQGGVELEWQVPTDVQRIETTEDLIHLKNEGVDLRVTNDHRMLEFNAGLEPLVTTPDKFGLKRGWWNAGQMASGDLEVDERILRLAVATQADGSLQGNTPIVFGFSKKRKIERLLTLLRPGEFTMKVFSNGKNKPTTAFRIPRGDLARQIRSVLTPDKMLPWSWINLTPRLRNVVLEEVQFWDGTKADNWRMYSYCTTKKQNADVLQALAVMSGRKTALRRKPTNKPNCNDAYGLSVRAKDNSRGDNVKRSIEAAPGRVVCLSVPSSYVVVRDGGIPIVVGQCVNFGFPGGLGARTFVAQARKNYGITFTEKEALEAKRAWLARWPEMQLLFDYVSRKTGACGASIEQLRPGGAPHRVRGNVEYCAALNTYFQSLTADYSGEAMWLISRECYVDHGTALYGSRLVGSLYDEAILEVPEDIAHEAAFRTRDLMVEAAGRWLPDVPSTAEPALMHRWSKAAEPTFDPTGRLIPWTPPVAAPAV